MVFWSLIILLVYMLTCLGTNGFSIKLMPRYSIDSVHFPKNLSQQEKQNRLVELSKARALHFQSMNFTGVINSTKQGIKELQPFVMNYESFYATKVAIGTPPYDAILLMATGSDETRVQGEGCTKCFDLISGNFKYKESRTYTMESCDSPYYDPRICIENVCYYRLLYDDGDHTTGYLSSETFKFLSEKEDKIYTDVIFRVGLENPKEPFMKDENTIGGIFGLGCGPQLILTQLEDETQLRFSYYLFDLTNGHDSYTYLHFGEDAQIIENEQAVVQETSLLSDQNQYHVQVLGIRMNKHLLPISQREFQLRDGSNGGFVIDLGSTLTYLVPNAYDVVRNEIVRYLEEAYNWNPMVNSSLNYDICYNVQPTKNQPFPSLVIDFVGAELNLGSHRVFKLISNNIYCMLIKPTSEEGVNVLGAIQQQEYRFLFDVIEDVMKFVSEKCQFNKNDSNK